MSIIPRIAKNAARKGRVLRDPAATRTRDPQLRRLLLYPTELRDQRTANIVIFPYLCAVLKKYLIVFLISMVPLIEIRGAIPYAVGFELPLVQSYIVAIIGNMLPVPFIFFFARRILEWGKDKKVIGKFFTWCLEKGEKGGRKLEAKAGRGLYWALLLFVGIPLPGTGAWTGTLAASILNMDFKKSVVFVMLGVILAGVIMLLGSLGIFGAIRLFA